MREQNHQRIEYLIICVTMVIMAKLNYENWSMFLFIALSIIHLWLYWKSKPYNE